MHQKCLCSQGKARGKILRTAEMRIVAQWLLSSMQCSSLCRSWQQAVIGNKLRLSGVACCGGLMAVGSSKVGQDSLPHTRSLTLKVNKVQKIYTAGLSMQVRERYSLSPMDISLCFSSKQLSYAKFLVKPCYKMSSFCFPS